MANTKAPATKISIDEHTSPEHLKIVQRILKFLNDKNANTAVMDEYVCGGRDYIISDAIVRRKKESKPGKFVYEVLSTNKVGQGSFSIVYDVKGTLAIQDDGNLIFKIKPEGKKRVSKIYDVKQTVRDSIYSEYEKTENLKHLRTKSPVLIKKNGRDKVVIFQRKQPGVRLDKFLKNIAHFSLQQRFSLAIAILHAIEEQVHSHGLLHRDIKASNIIVLYNAETKLFKISIIDYNLSCLRDKPDGKRVGTRQFMPKEAWIGQHNDSSDLFSAALIIGMIFDANCPKYISGSLSESDCSSLTSSSYELEETDESFISSTTSNSSDQCIFYTDSDIKRITEQFNNCFNFDDLLIKHRGYPPEIKTELLSLLQSMTNEDIAKRLPLQQCIATLESLKNKLQSKCSPPRFFSTSQGTIPHEDLSLDLSGIRKP